jgi:hypothetical protein
VRYPDEEVVSTGGLVDCLKKHLHNYDGPVWFRGQSMADWPLIPKLLRASTIPSEAFLINKFKQNATLLLTQRPKNDFEWLFLMQHYSMPTRLLDWTESPLVALYFTVTENETSNGALWMLLPAVLNEKSNYRPDYTYEVPSFEDEHLQNYLPETIAREHRSRLLPMAAIAPRNSSRMQVQQGVFTISHRENTPLENVGAPGAARDHVWRYIIPAALKNSLQRELRILGFSKFQLFPELDSLSSL